MLSRPGILAAAAISATSVSAQAPAPPAPASPAALATTDGVPYRHEPSGILLPTDLDGLSRAEGTEAVPGALDIRIQYRAAGEEATLSLYRMPIGSLPLWFEVSSRALLRNPNRSTTTLAIPPAAVAPHDRPAPTALIAGYTDDAGTRPTVLAMAERSGWIVKLRLSGGADVAGAVARAGRMLASVQWPSIEGDPPRVAPIADCATPLAIARRARPIRTDDAAAMQQSARSAIVNLVMLSPNRTAVTREWCRHPEVRNAPGGVFGVVGQADTYLVPLSDTGVAMRAGPAADLETLGIAGGSPGARRYEVQLWTADAVATHGGFNGVPPVPVAASALRAPPVHVARTGGTVEIGIDAGPSR